MNLQIRVLSFLVLIGIACQSEAQTKAVSLKTDKKDLKIAAFAEGCFWCSEHIFEAVEGVKEVVSGYAGGQTINPTYEEVCRETTGHAESILVYYDPTVISFDELLNVFFSSHDPTTRDQQGPDKGSSYRSVAFYQNSLEKDQIDLKIKDLESKKIFNAPIITQVLPLDTFYKAEKYHQDYIEHNPSNPYVINVSMPRFEKFKNNYSGKLKATASK